MGLLSWFRKKPNNGDNWNIPVESNSIGRPVGYEHLFIDVSIADVERALDGWNWLPLAGLRVIAVSAFGEPLFQDENGAIHQIDTIEGELIRVADSLQEIGVILGDVELRDQFFLEWLVLEAKRRGFLLADGECYDFRIAPVIGGQMSSEEMTKLSFVVKLHLAGQLHEQVKDLPPGTRINKLSISD